MKSRPTTKPIDSRARQAPPPAEHPALTLLAAAAFVLLAMALCVRPLLSELWMIFLTSLLASPEARETGTLMVRYWTHLIAAAGIGLGALWVGIARRRWRFSGLGAAALVLTAAALLAVPAASDKRLALNTTLDVILPLVAAATLYQLLSHRAIWRRALLAALLAVSAASCLEATTQHSWELEQARQRFEQNKASEMASLGLSADDPHAAIHEARLKANQPVAWFQHPNVLASFLLLGLAGSAAALVGARWWPAQGRALAWAIAASLVLVALAVWHLLVMGWIGSLGAAAGLLTALIVGPLAWFLRSRPRRLAILLAAVFLLLQAALVVLAVRAPALYPDLAARGGKVKSLAVRLNYWEGAIRLFADHPLTGVGPGQYSDRYLAIKPIYATEEVAHSHNWLLTMAADWGILGPVGVLLALGLAGWRILQSLALPPDGNSRSRFWPLLPAVLVVLACWWLLLADMPSAQQRTLLWPAAVSLVVLACVALSDLAGRVGQVVLLAGLAGFVIHTAVEMTSGVPAAMWPFWAVVALTLAWKGEHPAPATPVTPLHRRIAQAAPILAAVAAVAAIVLTNSPMSAADTMYQARKALAARQPEQALRLFRTAAQTDTLDPLPLRAGALLHYRLGQYEPRRAADHFRAAAELNRLALDRNPLNHMIWQGLALARMRLATYTYDFGMIRQAIDAMRTALQHYPNWPAGWLQLARMAAVTSETQPDQPDLLRIALEALDKAQTLDADWPADDLRKFSAKDQQEIAALRQDLQRRMAVATTQPAARRDSM